MFENLRGLLKAERRQKAASPEDAQRLAAAVLLLEVARADYEHQPAEVEALRTGLSREFAVSQAALDSLLGEAAERAKQSVSLFEFVQTLNRSMSPDQKRSLLTLLWRVAWADGQIDPHEEHLLRRITDLLHLSHADFIRGKLEAEKGRA